MSMDIRVPHVGESIREGQLVEWLRPEGALVRAEEPLFELETDKITLTVQASRGGRLHIAVPAGTRVAVGQVVGALLEETQGASPVAASPVAAPPVAAPPVAAPPVAPPPVVSAAAPAITPPAGRDQARARLERIAQLEQLSPAVRRLVEEHRLDPGGIPGTGPGGRVTKEDVLRHLEPAAVAGRALPAGPVPALPEGPAASGSSADLLGVAAATVAPAPLPPVSPPPVAAPAVPSPGARETRRPMSPLRQRIAERLVQAQQSAAILTTFNEADLSAVLALRERHQEAFRQRHGVKLGMMSFFIKAVVDALRTVPQLNTRLEGDEIVTQHYYDIGVAVGSEQGLVVPVLRGADGLSFAEIERQLADLGQRAQARKLTLAELTGGCFTVSNGGIYGSLLSTPILNPPQTGILGMHAIKRRPVAVGDEVVIRPMMYLALSYDHRLVDGREAVTFLRRVVDCVESPERLMLEV